MEPDEDHRSANPTDIEFEIALFEDILKLRVTAEIFETEEGAEVEDMHIEIFVPGDKGEWFDITNEAKEEFSAAFFNKCEERALTEWEERK